MEWIDVCPLDRLRCDRGVAALVNDATVAVFRLAGDELYAIDHVEPFTRVPVMARGLVGSVADAPTVASPLHKQRFDLRTGECLDHPGVSLAAWPVRCVHGMVQVGALHPGTTGTDGCAQASSDGNHDETTPKPKSPKMCGCDRCLASPSA